jgi:CheY-like chemotaxis protein
VDSFSFAASGARDLPIGFRIKINWLLSALQITQREFTRVRGKNSHECCVHEETKYHRKHNCCIWGMTRILLVEDSEDVLYLLRLQLEWMGYIVESASNANAALGAATKVRPDVIVSDLRMPGIDGYEFIQRVRRIRSLRSVPAIALTGASRDADIQRAIASGFTAHLAKPVEAGDLAAKVEQLAARFVQRKAS